MSDHFDIIVLGLIAAGCAVALTLLTITGHGNDAQTFRDALALAVGAVAGVARAGSAKTP